MPANFKDYPLYVYDDPAIYSTFSGGINTNPNNEHLDNDELRDCLNMHYNSAGLIKRPGAKQLCTIVCSDELFNIQGIFIFTHNISYLIIAANGKLYYGLYNENIKINLSRLYIYFTADNTIVYNSPYDMTIGLNTYTKELENQLNEGYICRQFMTTSGSIIDPDKYKVYDIIEDISEDGVVTSNNIIKFKNNYFFVNKTYAKLLITPDSEKQYNDRYWVKATQRMVMNYHTVINEYSNNNPGSARLVHYITDRGRPIISIEGSVNNWAEQTTNFSPGELVMYEGSVYICVKQHNCLLYTPGINTPGLTLLTYKDSLIFQNKKPIEIATYNNKCYIATGTRFTEVYLLNNQLQAFVCNPYKVSYNEASNLGNNLLSPYPEYCYDTLYNQVDTSLSLVIPIKNTYGSYRLTPICTYADNLSEQDMLFKWEKYVDDNWVTLISYKDNYVHAYKNYSVNTPVENIDEMYNEWDYYTTYKVGDLCYVAKGNLYSIYRCLYEHSLYSILGGHSQEPFNKEITIEGETIQLFELEAIEEGIEEQTYKETIIKKDYSTLDVNDAHLYKYRVSMCDTLTPAEPKNYAIYDRENRYYVGDLIYVETDSQYILYKCLYEHTPIEINPNTTELIFTYTDSDKEVHTLWQRANSYLDTSYINFNDVKLKVETITKYVQSTNYTYISQDFVPDKLNGYFGQATSTLYHDTDPHSFFNTIQSCSKILSNGNKLLLYDDAYSSGSWYKTKIDNPYYITERGCLSFKTNKNEKIIKVVNFSNNLIVFANTDNVGGSIHLVTGNGDDYDQDDYYSPFKRTTISESISCDNEKTIQPCENYLFFKYFNTIYFIVSSDLSNDVVNIYSANDKIKLESPYFTIPWDDNSCISEATEDYYALIWKEKYTITNQGLLLDHPAMRLKLYYKMAKQTNNKIYFPWLRDESKYFNVDNILYLKGSPIYLYNNLLISFNTQQYKDIDEPYKCSIRFKGVDTNYPKLLKVLSNVIVYYYNKASSQISLILKVYNEAGNLILDSTNQKRTLQNLRTLKVGSKLENNNVKTDYTTVSSKVFNTTYKFPYLLAEALLEAESDDIFALSSMTYIYTSMDTPDSTMYDTYTKIIRKKEI